MKHPPSICQMALLALTMALSACGLETAGTAAAVGTTQKQALEQGQATADKLQEQLQQANELSRQRNEALDKAGR